MIALWCSQVSWACAESQPGQPNPIWGYRIEDPTTISVLTSTDQAYDTWVAFVDETPTTVVISVRTKLKRPGAGAPVPHDLWLPVKLKVELGSRTVIDAIGNTPVAQR